MKYFELEIWTNINWQQKISVAGYLIAHLEYMKQINLIVS